MAECYWIHTFKRKQADLIQEHSAAVQALADVRGRAGKAAVRVFWGKLQGDEMQSPACTAGPCLTWRRGRKTNSQSKYISIREPSIKPLRSVKALLSAQLRLWTPEEPGSCWRECQGSRRLESLLLDISCFFFLLPRPASKIQLCERYIKVAIKTFSFALSLYLHLALSVTSLSNQYKRLEQLGSVQA